MTQLRVTCGTEGRALEVVKGTRGKERPYLSDRRPPGTGVIPDRAPHQKANVGLSGVLVWTVVWCQSRRPRVGGCTGVREEGALCLGIHTACRGREHVALRAVQRALAGGGQVGRTFCPGFRKEGLGAREGEGGREENWESG